MVLAQLESHIAALHNWTASRIENGEHAKAAELVKELRATQDTAALFRRAIRTREEA
jgi:hypothetical protein